MTPTARFRRFVHASPLARLPLPVWCLLLGLVSNLFSGNSDKLGLPIGLDRLFLAAAIVLAVLDPRLGSLRLRAIHAGMAIVVIAALVSAVGLGTIRDPIVFYALLDRLIIPFVLFTVAPFYFATAARRAAFLTTLTAIGAYLSVTTIGETLGANALVWPSYIRVAKAEQAIRLADETQRAGGPFLSGEANGMVLAMCGFAAILLATRSRGVWRLVALLTGPLSLLCSILSMTRSVWLGVAVAVVAVVASTRALWRWIPAFVGGALLVGTVAAAALPEIAAGILERGGTSRSLHDRENTNAAALRIIVDEPLDGVGWGQFVHVGWQWVRQADAYPLTAVNIEIHNVFLSRAAELGVPVALVFLAVVLAGPGRAVLRRQSDPELAAWRLLFLAIFCVWFVPSMTSPNPYPLPNFIMWLIAGYLAAVPTTSQTSGGGSDDTAAAPQGVQGAGVAPAGLP